MCSSRILHHFKDPAIYLVRSQIFRESCITLSRFCINLTANVGKNKSLHSMKILDTALRASFDAFHAVRISSDVLSWALNTGHLVKKEKRTETKH